MGQSGWGLRWRQRPGTHSPITHWSIQVKPTSPAKCCESHPPHFCHGPREGKRRPQSPKRARIQPQTRTRPQMRSQAGVLRCRWLYADFGQGAPPHAHVSFFICSFAYLFREQICAEFLFNILKLCGWGMAKR